MRPASIEGTFAAIHAVASETFLSGANFSPSGPVATYSFLSQPPCPLEGDDSCCAALSFSPWFSLAFVLLLIGGLGTAAFSNMQTALILTEAPFATRSRVMGIVTMCIGTGPLGVLTIGVLSEQFGPPVAILIMAGLGIGGLSLIWAKLVGVRPKS